MNKNSAKFANKAVARFWKPQLSEVFSLEISDLKTPSNIELHAGLE